MSVLLHELHLEHAEKRPDTTAIVFEERRLTYQQVEEQSNRLAHALADRRIEAGDRIALLLPKCPEAVVAMLAVMKVGAIYVPLDPASPTARLGKVIASCEPAIILAGGVKADVAIEVSRICTAPLAWMGPGPAPEKLQPAFSPNDTYSPATSPLERKVSPTDPAHILFTSGSTGQPKGVVITHAMVAEFITWANGYFGTTEQDKVSGHSPLFFDLSTFDIYGALAAGAELHMVPPNANLLPHKLADFIRRSKLTQWFSVPSILNYMAKFDVIEEDDFPSLQRILWCGEVFPTAALRHWMQKLPKIRFTNLYGPTEATIASSYYTLPCCPADDREEVPIGTACAGEELMVLDDRLERVAPGGVGDLYIAGVGLSPGYWRNPEASRAAFLEHEGGRIYKTGDLAKVDESGLFYYLGRADSQIKSRGYRIELGEIETALHSLDFLRECAVVAIDTGGFEGHTICCAYAVQENVSTAPPAIKARLRQLIPPYMIPSRWLCLDELPKTPNGKIHRPALRERFQAEMNA